MRSPLFPRIRHMAGVIPVANLDCDFGFVWHDCLQPIGPKYTAVERAVVECGQAGCNSIWVVCNEDMQPLIRHVLGEYVYDPKKVRRTTFRRVIPIYYVPIHPKDWWKRDSYGWSILWGALQAFRISERMSRWITPKRYYVAFPYGLYDPYLVRPFRVLLKQQCDNNQVFLRHNGKTIRDGEYLGFSFDAKDWSRYYRTIRDNSTDSRPRGDERFTGRFFPLDFIFSTAAIEDPENTVLELPWYYRIDSWAGLKRFYQSDHELERPSTELLSYREFAELGMTELDEDNKEEAEEDD